MKRQISTLKALIPFIITFNSSISLALDKEVKMGALIEADGLYYKSNGDETQRRFTQNNKNLGFYSTGNFYVDYKLVDENGLKYGTKISVQQTTRNDRGVPFVLYTETGYGKLELGSDKTAGSKMMVTGFSVACATGNGWDAFIVTSPITGKEAKVAYVTNFTSFLDAKTRTSMLSDYSRKITYFTPKIGSKNHNFQLGVSYSPDSTNAGHTGNSTNSDINDPNNLFAIYSAYPYKFAIKDGISYGAVYEGKHSDLLSTKLSLVGESGKPVAFNKSDNSKSNVKFKNLNTYNVGLQISYDKFAIAGSYMNYNNSLSNSSVDNFGSQTSIYSIGSRYKFCDDKYAASINYFFSNHKNNKLDAVSIGIDYVITKGIKAYIQETIYKANGKYVDNGVIKKDKNKGSLFILGAKISI